MDERGRLSSPVARIDISDVEVGVLLSESLLVHPVRGLSPSSFLYSGCRG